MEGVGSIQSSASLAGAEVELVPVETHRLDERPIVALDAEDLRTLRVQEARLDFSHALVHSGMRIAVRGVEPDGWLGPLDILLSADVLRLLALLAGVK